MKITRFGKTVVVEEELEKARRALNLVRGAVSSEQYSAFAEIADSAMRQMVLKVQQAADQE